VKNVSVPAALALGVLLLVAFIWHERRAGSPLMPLDLFRSRTFSGINALTLLLYAGLGGAFFLLPFDLIQVHGYSATLAGTVFLPFTIIMAVLSRWSGGLLDRVGARVPLIVGPTIAAAGLALFAASGATSSYWIAFLLPVVVVGLGMSITVAPLTTTVINAVPRKQAGVASGVNNAVASVATLFAIAIFGAVTLSSFNHALDHQLEDRSLSIDERQLIERAHGTFVIETSSIAGSEERRLQAEAMMKGSLSHAIHLAMLLAAGLALAGATAAAITIRQAQDPID
jgi:hypothetical protein